jgi:protein SCO1/2
MKKQLLNRYLPILVLICLIGIAIFYVAFTLPKHKNSSLVLNKTLTTKDAKPFVLDFTLLDKNNQPFEGKSLMGKPTLIYFGFTFCPDICPTALGKIVQVIDVLGKYSIPLNTVFITIDPERDTPESLAKYIKYFHSNITTLAGTSDDIAKVAKIFNVYYAKDQSSDADNYLLNHSSFIYILDKNGRLSKIFSLEDDPKDIIEFIRLNFR